MKYFFKNSGKLVKANFNDLLQFFDKFGGRNRYTSPAWSETSCPYPPVLLNIDECYSPVSWCVPYIIDYL